MMRAIVFSLCVACTAGTPGPSAPSGAPSMADTHRLLDRFGVPDDVVAVVQAKADGRPSASWAYRAGGGETWTTFGRELEVGEPTTLVAAQAAAARAVESFEGSEPEHSGWARLHYLSVEIAVLSRSAAVMGEPERARALDDVALRAPHASRPTEASTPRERLHGDIAMLAADRAIRDYVRAPGTPAARDELRARMLLVASVRGTEAVPYAQAICHSLDAMDRAEADASESEREMLRALFEGRMSLFQLASEPFAQASHWLTRLLDAPYLLPPVTTLGRGLPHLDQRGSAHMLLQHLAADTTERLAAAEAGLASLDAASHMPLPSSSARDANVAYLRAASRGRHLEREDIATAVERVLRRSGPADELRALYVSGTGEFRVAMLHALHQDEVRRELFEALVAASFDQLEHGESLPESAELALQWGLRPESPLPGAGDAVAGLLDRIVDVVETSRPNDPVPMLAAALAHAGALPRVLRLWDRLPVVFRPHLAEWLDPRIEPAAARLALLDEITLASPRCGDSGTVVLLADVVAIRLGEGAEFERGTPDVRRARREALAGGRDTVASPLLEFDAPGIHLYIHTEAGGPVLAAGLADLRGGPEGVRSVITALVGAQTAGLARAVIVRHGSDFVMEMAVRDSDGEMNGLMHVCRSPAHPVLRGLHAPADPASGPASGDEVLGYLYGGDHEPHPAHPLYRGAAPFESLLAPLRRLEDGEAMTVDVAW